MGFNSGFKGLKHYSSETFPLQKGPRQAPHISMQSVSPPRLTPPNHCRIYPTWVITFEDHHYAVSLIPINRQ